MPDPAFVQGLRLFEGVLDVGDGMARSILSIWGREQAREVLRLDDAAEKQLRTRYGRL